MATDFAVFLHRLRPSHLAGLRGCSPNTIASYRDTFKLLIAFFSDVRSIPPGKPPRLHRRRRRHRVPELAGSRTAQQHRDPQPAAGRDQLVLPVDAIPEPGPDSHLQEMLAIPPKSTPRRA